MSEQHPAPSLSGPGSHDRKGPEKRADLVPSITLESAVQLTVVVAVAGVAVAGVTECFLPGSFPAILVLLGFLCGGLWLFLIGTSLYGEAIVIRGGELSVERRYAGMAWTGRTVARADLSHFHYIGGLDHVELFALVAGERVLLSTRPSLAEASSAALQLGVPFTNDG